MFMVEKELHIFRYRVKKEANMWLKLLHLDNLKYKIQFRGICYSINMYTRDLYMYLRNMHYGSYAAMSICLRAARDIYSGSSSFARQVWRKFEIMQAPMLLIATTISSFVNGYDERVETRFKVCRHSYPSE